MSPGRLPPGTCRWRRYGAHSTAIKEEPGPYRDRTSEEGIPGVYATCEGRARPGESSCARVWGSPSTPARKRAGREQGYTAFVDDIYVRRVRRQPDGAARVMESSWATGRRAEPVQRGAEQLAGTRGGRQRIGHGYSWARGLMRQRAPGRPPGLHLPPEHWRGTPPDGPGPVKAKLWCERCRRSVQQPEQIDAFKKDWKRPGGPKLINDPGAVHACTTPGDEKGKQYKLPIAYHAEADGSRKPRRRVLPRAIGR